MAGTITHLAVADLICEKVGDSFFKSPSLFFCGNIAPDAVHARKDYIRQYKKHTHLTEGISGSDFQVEDKIKLYHSRLNEYIDKYYSFDSEYADLYLGYIVHLVTDEYFNIHIRKQFASALEKEGIKDTDKEFFSRFMLEIDSVDREILQKYPFKHDIKRMLDVDHGYEITDMISTDEAERSKRWIIDTLLSSEYVGSAGPFYNYDTAQKFITSTVDLIIFRFTEDTDFPHILIRK
ncbi:MAG: zinc dependent phospholipase C family protein [Clostridia bacterium]|nr:zinc dependent phospholipase C family protein [Clostridia bacterium]